MTSNTQQVFPISLGMVKAYLIKGKGNVLVDAGLPGKADAILAGLKNHNVDPKDISLIIVSHNHTDHVGDLHRLREITGAKVAIHKNEADALRQGKTSPVNPVSLFGKIVTKFFKNPEFKAVDPEILIEDELDLNEFGVSGKVIHTPGHTPGSVTVLLSNGEAIVGDMFSCKNTGKGSKATSPIFATDLKELKETLYKLVQLSPRVIYTSHGVSCSAEAVKELADKL